MSSTCRNPASRGQHSIVYVAIEAGYSSTIIGNTIRNHTNGIGHIIASMAIIGIYIEDCGDQGGAAGCGYGVYCGVDDQDALICCLILYFGTVMR